MQREKKKRTKPFREKLQHLLKSDNMYWLFPTHSKQPSSQKGISLLVAIMAIAVMMLFLADLILTSSVELELGISARDRIKAQYLAKSGLNLGIFLLSSSHAIDLTLSKEDMVPPLRKERADGPGSLWTTFNQLPPIGASTVDLIKLSTKGEEDVFGLKNIFSEKISEQMRLFEDQFSLNISDESSKINVNDCDGRCPKTRLLLTSLFSCPVEKEFLDGKNIAPEEIANKIADFISGNLSPESRVNYVDQPYEKYDPPFKAKKLPLDSVDELKLIDGWDDDMHAVFSPYLTVFPFKARKSDTVPININTAQTELLTCLIPGASKENFEKIIQTMHEKKKDGQLLASKETEVAGVLSNIFQVAQDGTKKEEEQPKNWLTNYSDTFRVVVKGSTGRQDVELVAIIKRIDPKDEGLGRKKHMVKRSYDVLYWHFM